MKLGSFYLQMYALVAECITYIEDDYRAEGCENSDEPSMTLTVGANAKGWNHQTGDNSFTGGDYGFENWAVATLSRDSDPHEEAESIIAQLSEYEGIFDAVAPKIHTESTGALRRLCRYQTHGGYVWCAVMSDSEAMCIPCVRKNYRQILRATRDHTKDGWAVEGIDHSGNWEDTEHCCNCGKVIWSKTE